MSYQNETIEDIYDDIQKLEGEIIGAAQSLQTLGEKEATAAGDYEGKKNRYLIELYAEESEPNFKGKRTEAHRTAMYRKMFEIERLQKSLATHENKSTQDYVKALLSVLNAKQSRMRILEKERDHLNSLDIIDRRVKAAK